MKKFLLILLLISFPALAEEPPACTEKTSGIVKCMDSKLCECGFRRGGKITGGKDGYRWDCGIDRPSCGADVNKVNIDQPPYDGPNAVGIDKSTTNIVH